MYRPPQINLYIRNWLTYQ